MNNNVLTITSIALVFLLALTPQLMGIKAVNATDRASLQWGTRYQMSQSEQDASYGACVAIRAYFYGTGQYNYLENYYGSETQQATVLGNVSECEDNYDYATVFYKGHCCYSSTCHKHYYLYDNDGGGATDRIWDFGVGYRTSNGEHDFVFIWACGPANEIGGISGSPPHTWGFPASWMGTTSLNGNGYEEEYPYDYGPNCYIGFKNYSKPFTESTGYGGWSYRYWCTYFYLYCLRDGYSIKEALDAASQTTINDEFSDTDLYQGYEIYQFGIWWDSKMWVYGNGDIELPH